MATSSFRQIAYRDDYLSLSVNERLSSDHLIVCIHGLGCSKESFDGLFTVPDLEPYSICAIDLPGHGDSDKPENFTYGMDEHANAVRLVIEQINPNRISVIAHSMGGAVGLLFSTEVAIENFVSVEGNLVAEDCGYASRRIADQSFQEFLDHGYEEFLRPLESSERADFQTWLRWLRQASPKALHEGALSLVEWSDSGRLLDIFNDIEKKAYIYGDEDEKDFLLHQLQSTLITPISNAGHFSMIDNPEEFKAAVVQGFMKSPSDNLQLLVRGGGSKMDSLPEEVNRYYRELANQRNWHQDVLDAFLQSVAFYRQLDEQSAERSYFAANDEEGIKWFFETVSIEGQFLPVKQIQKFPDGKVVWYSWQRLEDERGGLSEAALDVTHPSVTHIDSDAFLREWNP